MSAEIFHPYVNDIAPGISGIMVNFSDDGQFIKACKVVCTQDGSTTIPILKLEDCYRGEIYDTQDIKYAKGIPPTGVPAILQVGLPTYHRHPALKITMLIRLKRMVYKFTIDASESTKEVEDDEEQPTFQQAASKIANEMPDLKMDFGDLYPGILTRGFNIGDDDKDVNNDIVDSIFTSPNNEFLIIPTVSFDDEITGFSLFDVKQQLRFEIYKVEKGSNEVSCFIWKRVDGYYGRFSFPVIIKRSAEIVTFSIDEGYTKYYLRVMEWESNPQ